MTASTIIKRKTLVNFPHHVKNIYLDN